jgi:sec-independent protein translocase protein TatA
MFGLGTQELLIIAIVLVLLFGATKIPQLMRGLGTGVKEFRSAMKEDDPGPERPEAASSENPKNSGQ